MEQSQQNTFQLRVLSGSNSGAKTLLRPGTYTIGNSNECDIILHDEYITPEHASITVSEKGLLLTPLAHPVYLAGHDIGSQDTKLRLYQVMTLGKTHIAVGAADQKWPKLVPPVFTKENTESSIKKHSKDSSTSGGWIKYLVGGLLLLTIANLFYFKPDVSGVLTSMGAKPAVTSSVEDALHDMNLNDSVEIDTQYGGKVFVKGYVKDSREKQELVRKIKGLDKSIAHRIWVDDELTEHAYYIANTFDESNIRFSMTEHGVLTADGYVKNAANWQGAKIAIMNDIDGIKTIEDSKVDSLQQQLDKLRKYIEKESFAQRMLLNIESGKITASGELTDDELSRWEAIKKEFEAEYGVIPNIAEDLKSPRDRFKLALRSVSVGKVPFIVSTDNKKYMVGSHLGDGYYITSITSDRILLRHNDIEIPVYFGKKARNDATDGK